MKSTIGRFGAAAAFATVLGAATMTTAAAQAEIDPGVAASGDGVEVLINCGEGSDSASVSLTELGGASEAALEEVEGNPGVFFGGFEVPSGIAPGDYTLSFSCSDGTGDTATLTVAPADGPDTGVAESGADGQLLVLAGAVAAGAAAAGLLARRRAAGSSGA